MPVVRGVIPMRFQYNNKEKTFVVILCPSHFPLCRNTRFRPQISHLKNVFIRTLPNTFHHTFRKTENGMAHMFLVCWLPNSIRVQYVFYGFVPIYIHVYYVLVHKYSILRFSQGDDERNLAPTKLATVGVRGDKIKLFAMERFRRFGRVPVNKYTEPKRQLVQNPKSFNHTEYADCDIN